MRSVYSHSFGKPAKSSRFFGAPVTKWLLIVLAVLFVIDVSGRSVAENRAGYLLPYLSHHGDLLHHAWRWVTYPLVNLSAGEWLFSMIVLFSFGKLLEPALGSRKYAMLLGITTIVGAIVYMVLSLSTGSNLPLTGANGVALAILVAVAVLYPDQVVQLMIPPIPLKVKNLVIGLIVIIVVMAIAQRTDPVITLPHLSAIGVSFLCMKKKHWLDVGVKRQLESRKTKKTTKKRAVKKKAGGMKARTELNMKISKQEAEINKILDKVSAEGIGNLTKDEREILKFASKK